MSMRAWACHGTLISLENLLKVCPESMQRLLDELERQEQTIDSFAIEYEAAVWKDGKWIGGDDFADDESFDKVCQMWKQVVFDFEVATEVEGRRMYVDLISLPERNTGEYTAGEYIAGFGVGNVWQYTPAAEKLRKRFGQDVLVMEAWVEHP